MDLAKILQNQAVSKSLKSNVPALNYLPQSPQAFFNLMQRVIGPRPQQLRPRQTGVLKLNIVYF